MNQKKKELIQLLKDYQLRWGYYKQHSVKINDEWITKEYPIPVISVEHIGDIGLTLIIFFLRLY